MLKCVTKEVTNPKAISDLYDQYSPALYGMILRIVKSHSKAEAIVEHTFLKILEEIDTYRKLTTFFTWMCSIARRLAAESVTSNIPRMEAQMNLYCKAN